MSESLEFIKDRATKTLSAARQLAATWVWQQTPIADYQAALTAIIGDQHATPPVDGQETITSRAEQAMLHARGVWDDALARLHRATVQALGMARNRFRDEPAKLGQLAGLSARGTSRTETLDEALAWESAWLSVDPAWEPLTTNTLTTFKELRRQCDEDLKTGYADAQAEWRREAERLRVLGLALEDLNVAWYADATRVFAAGTAEGDMLRGTIPTTYNPPPDNTPPPTPPAPPAPPHG